MQVDTLRNNGSEKKLGELSLSSERSVSFLSLSFSVHQRGDCWHMRTVSPRNTFDTFQVLI